MNFEYITYEKKGAAAWIVKGPKGDYGIPRGAVLEMERALDDAGDDTAIRVLVLTAGGEGFHNTASSFFDEASPDFNLSAQDMRSVAEFGHRFLNKLEKFPKPVIGVAKGGAQGGGMESLHPCDFIIAAEDARFSQPETCVDMLPGWGGSQRLARIVGWRKAKMLLMTGQEIDGREAERIGLVTMAFPKAQVDAEVDKLVKSLIAQGPNGLAYTKRAMLKTWETNHQAGLEYEAEALGMAYSAGQVDMAIEAYQAGESPEFSQTRPLCEGPDWRR